MAATPSGTTVNGRKPIATNVVHDYGHRGGAGTSSPKQSQIAGQGARDPGTGRHMQNSTESRPNLAPTSQVITTGTTAEEQRKKLASSMYPSSRGLRQYMD